MQETNSQIPHKEGVQPEVGAPQHTETYRIAEEGPDVAPSDVTADATSGSTLGEDSEQALELQPAENPEIEPDGLFSPNGDLQDSVLVRKDVPGVGHPPDDEDDHGTGLTPPDSSVPSSDTFPPLSSGINEQVSAGSSDGDGDGDDEADQEPS